MATPLAEAAAARRTRGPGVKSREARSVALDLLDAPKMQRRVWLHDLERHERAWVLGEVQREAGTMFALWHDDPVGFTEDVLGETMWGLQGEVMASIAVVGVKRIVVPAGFGVGKTFLAGRMVAWAGAVNPIGSIKIVTTATRMRQVRSQLWPHIKTAVSKGKLPGRTDTVQWVADDMYGNEVQIAYGFSAPPNDEAAMQGIHGTPKLLLVVDEAGGIAPLIGKGTNNLLTGEAKLLAIGNPAMNEPGSWFERLSARGADPEEPNTHRVHISALHSPAITGEPTPVCRACVPNLDGHTISEGVNGESHLPDWTWLRDTLGEYGVFIDRDERDLAKVRELIRESGHPYLVAKVLAEFPKDVGNQVMPSSWVEAAADAEDPAGEDYVRLGDLGLPDETDQFTVKKGSWVRLGVDVASDGGDEFAVYRAIGDVIHQRHASSGKQNADSNHVTDVIVAEIQRANALRIALGTTAKVRVKVDANGLGWGIVGNLRRLVKEGLIDCEVVAVMVAESPHKVDEAAVMRPYRKRDEMWLAGRFMLQMQPGTGAGRLRLRIDHQAKVQLSLPQIGYNSRGDVVVESKANMKKRGVSSPDRAEAALLSIYEPEPLNQRRRRGLLN